MNNYKFLFPDSIFSKIFQWNSILEFRFLGTILKFTVSLSFLRRYRYHRNNGVTDVLTNGTRRSPALHIVMYLYLNVTYRNILLMTVRHRN